MGQLAKQRPLPGEPLRKKSRVLVMGGRMLEAFDLLRLNNSYCSLPLPHLPRDPLSLALTTYATFCDLLSTPWATRDSGRAQPDPRSDWGRFSLLRMASAEIPLADLLVGGDARAKALKVPQRFMVLAGHTNIQRVGAKAARNDYICREEGCTWSKKSVPAGTAKKHGKTHDGKPCHIFEAVRGAEVLEQYAAKNKAKCKRHRERVKEERAVEPRHKRLRGVGLIPRPARVLIERLGSEVLTALLLHLSSVGINEHRPTARRSGGG